MKALSEEAPREILPPMPVQPPPGPVHSCAEWEESEGIILDNYWKNADTILKLQQDHHIYVQCNNQAAVDKWLEFLDDNSIPLTNIHFIVIRCNFGSMRDCGPWFIWDGNNELCIVNNTCWGGTAPLDDEFPSKFAREYGYKYYEPTEKIYCEGGNFYPNAYGLAFSSSYVYADNKEKSKAHTDSLFRDWLGIETYNTPAPNLIWHHDTWGKPANPETLIVVQWPETHKNYPVGEGMAAYYETLQSPWGRPYKIHRLPMFPFGGTFKPYMNSLVANKKVFVPVTGSKDDEIALAVFEAAFVGYEVVGIDYHGTQWQGSFHCATKNIMKRDVIRIYPLPPGDTEVTDSGYTVLTRAIPINGNCLLPGYPVLHWTDTGGAPFNQIVMDPTGKPNDYEAEIPAQEWGTTVSFYIEAKDDGGLSAVYPPVAPDGMMSFTVREDVEPPELSRFVPARSAAAGQGLPCLRALCKDDMATPQVHVEYTVNGVPQPDAALSREEMCFWYTGLCGDNFAAGDLVTYRVVAADNAQAANTSALPKLGEIHCPVAPAKDSVGVVNLGLRPHTGPFMLEALGGLGIPHHYYAEWPEDFSAHDTWFIFLGVFAYNHILTADEAQDIVNALQADKNIYLEGGDTWCHDPEKETLKPWFGVEEVGRGGGLASVDGARDSILEGLQLSHAHEAEDICFNRISALAPALPLLTDSKNGSIVGVQYDAGTYRTIAGSVPLGALVDDDWPSVRKEILRRYLAFFGFEGIELMATVEAEQGAIVPVLLEGEPGDEFLVMASLAENYLNTGYGIFRLDPGYMFILGQGIIPTGGFVEFDLLIPRNEDLIGYELHLQAAVGVELSPGHAFLTNREILPLVE
jgi:agmatine/peptidylarginine deiminase